MCNAMYTHVACVALSSLSEVLFKWRNKYLKVSVSRICVNFILLVRNALRPDLDAFAESIFVFLLKLRTVDDNSV